ncbi:hypothetical protein HBI60_259460 [Parastagonospora nodorum]|nr:hypothetical protein HBI60_259460 [Parastagonospora nodorum]
MSRATLPQERKRTNSSFSTSSTLGGVELSDTDSATGSIRASTPAKISEFWSTHKHHDFTPDPRAALHDELERLATLEGWSRKTMMKREKEALAAELALYDDGKDRLDRWQQLCVEVGVADLDELPKSISACKKKLNAVRVNICNLVDHRRNPQTTPLLRFDSYCDLSLYTQGDRVCPKGVAKQDGIVRGLLRRI